MPVLALVSSLLLTTPDGDRAFAFIAGTAPIATLVAIIGSKVNKKWSTQVYTYVSKFVGKCAERLLGYTTQVGQ